MDANVLLSSVLAQLKLNRTAFESRAEQPSFAKEALPLLWQAVLTEDLLAVLNHLFAGDGVLDRALEALDNRLVCRVTSPSGSVVHQVNSTIMKGRTSDVKELGSEGCYTVIDGFCTCADYHTRVILGTQERQYCKHNLAVALAEAVGLEAAAPPAAATGGGGSGTRRGSVSKSARLPLMRIREISDLEMSKLLATI